MWKYSILVVVGIVAAGALVGRGCIRIEPPPWTGPTIVQPRTQLTVEALSGEAVLPLADMSFFSRPAWGQDDATPFSGTVSFDQTDLDFPKPRAPYPGEDLFPRFTLELMAHDGKLMPRQQGVIDTRSQGDSFWDVIVGVGEVWREAGDVDWSRAALPLNLVDRYMGQVRNCVATFAYDDERITNAYVQCSQETADLPAQQLGDIRAMVPATYAPTLFPDADLFLDEQAQREAGRIPVRPLSAIDTDREIADYFDKSLTTRASTTLGAVYMDGTLYVNPPKTRHGLYPYPDAMRFGVYSVSKSMAGALALFYFAERYGADIFDTPVVEHVPAFANKPEWQGVTFAHLINMATGARGGEGADVLLNPLILAPTAEEAINNIARLGDAPPAPGEAFNYATTNTFVLSYALDNLVKSREGEGVRYWDLLHDNVLVPIGASGFRVLYTRDEDAEQRIPFLGYGALPNLDHAAKIARLIASEGRHDGEQLLNANRIREALGRTEWPGYYVNRTIRYRHSLWSGQVWAGDCDVNIVYMQGFSANHVIFLPSGVIIFRFMDENDMDFAPLVRSVERVRSSCQ